MRDRDLGVHLRGVVGYVQAWLRHRLIGEGLWALVSPGSWAATAWLLLDRTGQYMGMAANHIAAAHTAAVMRTGIWVSYASSELVLHARGLEGFVKGLFNESFVVASDLPCADVYVFRDAIPQIPGYNSAALVYVDHEAGLTTFRGAAPLEKLNSKNLIYLGTSHPMDRFLGTVIELPFASSSFAERSPEPDL